MFNQDFHQTLGRHINNCTKMIRGCITAKNQISANDICTYLKTLKSQYEKFELKGNFLFRHL